MSATTRREKMIELRIENNTLRMERNASIMTNSELLKENAALRTVYDCLKRREEYQTDALWFADLHYYMKQVAELDIDTK